MVWSRRVARFVRLVVIPLVVLVGLSVFPPGAAAFAAGVTPARAAAEDDDQGLWSSLKDAVTGDDQGSAQSREKPKQATAGLQDHEKLPPGKDKPKAKRVRELTDKRTPSMRVYETDQHTYSADLTAEPNSYKEDGDWHEIDPEVADSDRTGFDLENSTNLGQSWFGEDPDDLVRYKDSDSGAEIALSPVGTGKSKLKPAKGSGTEGANKVTYKQVFGDAGNSGSSGRSGNSGDSGSGGADLQYTTARGGLQEDIVLDQAPAAGEQPVFRFRLDSGDLVPVQRKDGAIEIVNPQLGMPVFTLPAAYMRDSTNSSSDPAGTVSSDAVTQQLVKVKDTAPATGAAGSSSAPGTAGQGSGSGSGSGGLKLPDLTGGDSPSADASPQGGSDCSPRAGDGSGSGAGDGSGARPSAEPTGAATGGAGAEPSEGSSSGSGGGLLGRLGAGLGGKSGAGSAKLAVPAASAVSASCDKQGTGPSESAGANTTDEATDDAADGASAGAQKGAATKPAKRVASGAGDGYHWEVVITPDADWLRSSDRRYPVMVDPTISVQPGDGDAQDAMVSSADADKNYAGWPGLRVGKAGSSSLWRSFVKFPIADIPAGAKIDSAMVGLYYNDAPVGNDNALSYDIHRVTGSWTESNATWNSTKSLVGERSSTTVQVDDGDVGTAASGSWTTRASETQAEAGIGHDYLFNQDAKSGDSYTWQPSIGQTATYQVWAHSVTGTNRATNAPFTVTDANETYTTNVDQSGDNYTSKWTQLGTTERSFTAGTKGKIVLKDPGDGVDGGDRGCGEAGQPGLLLQAGRSGGYVASVSGDRHGAAVAGRHLQQLRVRGAGP